MERLIHGVDDILSMKLIETPIPGGVFDPMRRATIKNSWENNCGRDISVTQLSEDGKTGTNTVKKNLIPFSVLCKPLYDNERYLFPGAFFQSFRKA